MGPRVGKGRLRRSVIALAMSVALFVAPSAFAAGQEDEQEVADPTVAKITSVAVSQDGPYCPNSQLSIEVGVDGFVDSVGGQKGNTLTVMLLDPDLKMKPGAIFTKAPESGIFTAHVQVTEAGNYQVRATLNGGGKQLDLQTQKLTVEDCPSAAPELDNLAFDPDVVWLDSEGETGETSITGDVVNYQAGDAVAAMLSSEDDPDSTVTGPFDGVIEEDGSFTIPIDGLTEGSYLASVGVTRDGEVADSQVLEGLEVELWEDEPVFASFESVALSPEGPYCVGAEIAVQGKVTNFENGKPPLSGTSIKTTLTGPAGFQGLETVTEFPEDGTFAVEVPAFEYPGDYRIQLHLYDGVGQVGQKNLNFTVDAECPAAPELTDVAFDPAEVVLDSADVTGESSITGNVVNYQPDDVVTAILELDDAAASQELGEPIEAEIAEDGSFVIALSDLAEGTYGATVGVTRDGDVADSQELTGLVVKVEEPTEPTPDPTDPTDPTPDPTEPGEPTAEPTEPRDEAPEPGASTEPGKDGNKGELPNTGASVAGLMILGAGAVGAGAMIRRKARS